MTLVSLMGLALMHLAEVIPPADEPTLTVDLLDLAWWQQIGILIGALGLSPAPWILGLATSRIQFTKAAAEAHEREIADLKESHQRELTARSESFAREKAQMERYHESVVASKDQRYADLVEAKDRIAQAEEAQRQRADTMTAALSESANVLKMTNHILEELKASAKEVGPSGQPALEQ